MASGPTFCLFKLTTGLNCPGCGMTRALSALLHGDIERAVILHPLVVVVFPILVALWISLVVEVVGRRPLLSGVPASVLNRFSTALVALFIAVWVFRTVNTLSLNGLGCFDHSIIHRLAQIVTSG
ncbi:MAG: DUF2752 domain-containing protein [Deltaproteobacteria bacterium]|nr:DUF2752 domain-containing protein [Deltaproteobacteria bacterium]